MNCINKTKNWIQSFVIQLNLCPFAKKPFFNDKIRYRVYEGMDWEELALVLHDELFLLKNTPKEKIETSFLITPNFLKEFYFYLDFLEFANDLICALHLEGVLQIASFHPDYQFEGTEKDDVTNYTNCSPFPMFHLLREDSLEDALAHYKEPESIPERNMKTLRARRFER